MKTDLRIKCAAIQHDGKIYEGQSHAEIGHQMLKDKACKRPFPGGDAQGFVTECGKFMSRMEAMYVAIAAGQVEEGKTCHPYKLFSEDIRGVK